MAEAPPATSRTRARGDRSFGPSFFEAEDTAASDDPNRVAQTGAPDEATSAVDATEASAADVSVDAPKSMRPRPRPARPKPSPPSR